VGAFVLWNHGAGDLVQYRRWATAPTQSATTGGGGGLKMQERSRTGGGEAAALAARPPCALPTWLEWLAGRFGAREVWRLTRPPVPRPAPHGKFPVRQRAYLALASRGGGLELRLGMPWAGRGDRALHTLGSRFGDFHDTSNGGGSGGFDGSGSSGKDIEAQSRSSRRSAPRGYRSVVRLHRSGALCVLLEEVGVGLAEPLQ
jgi:hypothetical protein